MSDRPEPSSEQFARSVRWWQEPKRSFRISERTIGRECRQRQRHINRQTHPPDLNRRMLQLRHQQTTPERLLLRNPHITQYKKASILR
jgi:hypothetical protein